MAKIIYVQLDRIVPFAENPREKLEFHDLVGSIRSRGLDKPLKVRQHPVFEDGVEIAQGHRRFGAIAHLAVTDPESFKSHFPKGVPCEIMPKETTQQEFILAVADHGESRALTTDYELYMLVKLLTKAGLTRDAIIVKIASLLNTAKPFRKPELTAKVNELTRIIDDPNTPVRDRAKADVEYEDLVVKARTGLIQRYQAIHQMPEIVEVAYQLTCTGVRREEYEETPLPSKLTEVQIKKLHSSKDGYLKDVDNGEADGAPLFWERWADVLKEANEAKPADEARKSRSRKEVVETAKAMESEMAKTILGYASNESGIGEEKVRALDEALQVLEYLQTVKPAEYAALLTEYRTWAITNSEALNG